MKEEREGCCVRIFVMLWVFEEEEEDVVVEVVVVRRRRRRRRGSGVGWSDIVVVMEGGGEGEGGECVCVEDGRSEEKGVFIYIYRVDEVFCVMLLCY